MEYSLEIFKEQIEYLNCREFKHFYDKLIAEPVFDEFKHKSLICRVVKHNSFNCGYVGVPKEHKCFENSYHDIEYEIDVHGGLTFSDFFEHIESNYNKYYYIGFDCAHGGDFIPGVNFGLSTTHINSYKDYDFVKKECIKLAEQLIEIDPKYKILRRKMIIAKTFLN